MKHDQIRENVRGASTYHMLCIAQGCFFVFGGILTRLDYFPVANNREFLSQ